MSRQEIRVSGFGGQGIIFLAYITGRAAAIHEGRHATLNQSFGPEARGSACSAQLILSDDPVDYPYIRQPDILIAMSQDAYAKYADELTGEGTLLVDEDLVHPRRDQGRAVHGVPATRIAEGLGRRICANMVMCGFLSAVTGVMAREAAREAIRLSVPPGSEELNLRAFDEGYAHGTKTGGGATGGAKTSARA
ncbi:MAG: 2-oxoacid:acceptor oxidoreductase family protein [Candidatus Eisenbacteria bacterium]|nr:2-oxoacid:acceptor oxidoreductase family protein [Candidatus Eisenbacteria bacterium]